MDVTHAKRLFFVALRTRRACNRSAAAEAAGDPPDRTERDERHAASNITSGRTDESAGVARSAEASASVSTRTGDAVAGARSVQGVRRQRDL